MLVFLNSGSRNPGDVNRNRNVDGVSESGLAVDYNLSQVLIFSRFLFFQTFYIKSRRIGYQPFLCALYPWMYRRVTPVHPDAGENLKT